MVVTVIIVMMSLLLPALSKAKQTAYRVNCIGNLKQLHNAEMMYINDNNGYAMDYLYGPSRWWAWYDAWGSPFRNGGYFPSSKVELYSLKGTILDCKGVPDNPEKTKTFDGSTDNHTYWTNYAYNSSFFRRGKVERVLSPSKKILFVDSSHYYIDYDNYSTKLYPSHNGAPNMVFVDGHTGWFKNFTYGVSTTTYRSWFDCSDFFQ